MTAQSNDHPQGSQWLSRRLRALRAFSFPVSVLPVILATAIVLPAGDWKWGIVVTSALAVMFLHAAGNLFNDYFDFASGVDHREEGDEDRPGRLLVRGELSPRDILIEAFVCLAVALPMGVYLLSQCGPKLFIFAAVALVGLYAYTGPPFQMKYHALGEPVIFLVFGPVLMVGAAFAQSGSIDVNVLLVSIPVGFATTAVLVGNNIRDLHEDRDAGVVTLARALGPARTRVLYVLLVVGSAVVPFALAVAKVAPPVAAATPILLVLIKGSLVSTWRGERVADIDARTARFASALIVLLTVAFLLRGAPA